MKLRQLLVAGALGVAVCSSAFASTAWQNVNMAPCHKQAHDRKLKGKQHDAFVKQCHRDQKMAEKQKDAQKDRCEKSTKGKKLNDRQHKDFMAKCMAATS